MTATPYTNGSVNKDPAPTPRHVPLVSPGIILPFVLVTSLFALWGFANDVTNPLVKAFRDVFVISNAQSSLVQTAFYGGYATMALPAALFIRRFSYKAGILLGLALYATGAFLAIPAAAAVNFNLFLVALYVLTFGLAFLETTANPYVLSMGAPETATRRLNLAQAFNPIGSLAGMVVASTVILSSLQVEAFREDVGRFQKGPVNGTATAATDPGLAEYLASEEARRVEAGATSLSVVPHDLALAGTLAAFKDGAFDTFEGRTFREMQAHDLTVIKTPYVVIGLVVLGVMAVFLITRMPDTTDHHERIPLGATFAMLLRNARYREGLVAQGFYVGAQIMCWTFIIHYATGNLGMSAATAQNHNIAAMAIFCGSRFVCTFLLKYLSPGRLLMGLASGAIVLTGGVILGDGLFGLYCLVGISACMSLMFPTIYGIALDGMGDEAKIASAGLIFAIVGGALMPPLQGSIIDLGGADGRLLGLPAVSASFVLPLLCFVVIALYGLRTVRVHHERAEAVTH